MNSAWLPVVSGLVVGVIGSYLAWLIIARIHLPKLKVSKICRSPDQATHRIKVWNVRRISDVSHLSIECRLLVKGLNPKHRRSWTSIRIPVGDEHPFPALNPREDRVYHVHLAGMLEEKEFEQLSPQEASRVSDIAAQRIELIPEHSHDFVRVSVSGAHEIGGLHRTFTFRYGPQRYSDWGVRQPPSRENYSRSRFQSVRRKVRRWTARPATQTEES